MTQIRKRQIADGQIDDSKIQAGAAIASSKLADGAKIIFADGSSIMLAALNMGGFNFSNLSSASGAGQAVEYNQFQTALSALNTMFSAKQSVRVASTANVTLSGPGTAIDGITLVNGNRVLLKDQTTASQNGIYVFNGSAAAMTRATDMDSWAEVPGVTVPIEEGTANADTIFLSSSNQGGTLGTTAITFVPVGVTSGLQHSNFVNNETPAGSINGSNTTFTLANTPVVGSEQVFLNGMLLEPGGGNDYTISGTAITLAAAPETGEKIKASYRK